MWSGGTWTVSDKMVESGSFNFRPTTGIMDYETPENGHYEIAIFGSVSGLTGVTIGDTLVFNGEYWVNEPKQTTNYSIITLTSDINLNPDSINTKYEFIIKQDNVGSHIINFGSVFRFPNNVTPTLPTDPYSVSVLSGVSDGTNIFITSVTNF